MKNFFTKLVFVLIAVLSTSVLSEGYAATPYSAYNLSKTTKEYTEITDGTVLGSKAYGSEFNNAVFLGDTIYTMPSWGSGKFKGPGVPLGFSLKIGDASFSHALIGANGHIHFIGNAPTEVSGYPSSPYNISPSQKFLFRFSGNVKAAQTLDTDAKTTQISYQSMLIGQDSVFVVQYKNLLIETGTNVWDTASFQIRIFKSGLHEVAIKKIGFTGTKTDLKFSFGFQNFANDFIAFTGAATNQDWAKIEKFSGTYVSSEGIMLNSNAIPAPNTFFKLEAPAACVKPELDLSLSKLELTTTSIKAKVSASQGFDQVLVLLSPKAELTAQPVDGVSYQNHQLIGGASILHQGLAEVEFNNNRLEGDSTYYLHIYPKNYLCADGPLYGKASIFNFRTNPKAPVLKLASMDETSANIEMKSAKGTSVLMAATEKAISLAQYDAIGASLAKNESFEVGDIILPENQVKVIHAGEPTTYQWTSLKANTKYFFYAWSYKIENEKYIYSTDQIDSSRLSLLKNYTSPAILSFDNEDEIAIYSGNATPAGWSRLQTNGKYMYNFMGEDMEMDASLANFYYQKEMLNQGGGGWPSPSAKMLQEDENMIKVLKATMNMNAGVGIVDSLDADIITPKILVTSKLPQRFAFNFGANVSGWLGSEPYSFAENDTLFVQISENGKDWKTLKKISLKEAEKLELYPGIPASCEVKVEGYYNKEVQFRVVWHSYDFNSFLLGDFVFERYSLCKPVKSMTAIADSAAPNALSWSWEVPTQEQDNEALGYQVRVQDLKSQTWSQYLATTKNQITFEPLNPNAPYAIEVVTVCPSDTANPSLPSSSQYTLPNLGFKTDFQSPEWSSQKNLSDPVLPPYWNRKTAEFDESGDLDFSDPLSGSWFVSTYRLPGDVTDVVGDKNLSLSIQMANIWGGWDFFSLPPTKLKANHQALKFTYTLSINHPSDSNTAASNDLSDFDYGVFYSTDGGKTLKKADHVQLIEHRSGESRIDTIEDQNYSFEIPSTESGNIVVMIGVKPLGDWGSTYPRIYIDNISLDYACSSIENLLVKPDYTEAEFTWKEWDGTFVLRHKEQGAQPFAYDTISSGTSFTLSGLEDNTSYEYGVKSICEGGSEGEWTQAFFTTMQKPFCDTITGATASIGKNSARITWTGLADSANIRYRAEDSLQWNTLSSQGKTINLEGLTAGTDYVYQLQQKCGEDISDTGQWSKHYYFSTLPLTCFVPTGLECIATTYQRATVVSKTTASQRIYALKLDEDGAIWNEFVASKDTVAFTMLSANASYLVKVRALCAFGDTSEFSETIRFTMTDVPVVKAPKNLKAENITSNSALLSWDTADNHIMYMLLYKESSKSTFDTINRPLYETKYKLSFLKENTTYDWKVMAIFDQWIQSPFSTTASFTTKTISIEDVSLNNASFGVSAANGQLRIQNFAQTRIDKIEIYSIDGRKIENFEIRHANDLSLTTRVRNTVAAVRILCGEKVLTYKIYFY